MTKAQWLEAVKKVTTELHLISDRVDRLNFADISDVEDEDKDIQSAIEELENAVTSIAESDLIGLEVKG